MEKKGIRMEDIEPHLKAMSYGHKSNGLVEMNPELENGMRVSTKGRVSLEEQADGSLRVVPHYWQERPDLDAPFHGNIRNYGGVREGMTELRVWIDSQTEEEIRRGVQEAKPMSAYRSNAPSPCSDGSK